MSSSVLELASELPSRAIILGLLLFLTIRAALRRWGDIVRQLDGPEAQSWLYGNMLQLHLPPVYGHHEFKWQERYGPVYRFAGCFGQTRLMLSDPVALTYILKRPAFVHGPTIDNIHYMLYGPRAVITKTGAQILYFLPRLLSMELTLGDAHRKLRSVLNEGFTPSAVRGYQSILEEIAANLADKWEELAARNIEGQSEPLNVSFDLSIATLDAISRAILGRTTEQLGEKFMQSNFAVMALSSAQSRRAVLTNGIECHLPTPVRRLMIHLPNEAHRIIATARGYARQLGDELVEEKLAGKRSGVDVAAADFYGRLVAGKDDAQELSKEDIAGQTGVILIAGQDTTANATAFALYHLSKDPELQNALREEIATTLAAPRTSRTLVYDSMPLLNATLKESLRMYPAETMTDRTATRDTVIPLSQPVTTPTGHVLDHLAIRRGQIVTVNIGSYQRQTQRWGSDPHVFRPGRWLDGSVVSGEAVGPYANLLSFLSGTHMCLGWRFAVLELQVLLCTLVGKFSFSLSENGDEPIPTWRTTVIPVRADGKKGAMLRVRRVL
ncbi:Cytochrome P450 [Mycena kentingensis (nom. inval.)]|nr:Cytochrome P450 [Mycena kentingensis (nom. inval.)]